MRVDCFRAWTGLAVAACLGWACVEAPGVSWGGPRRGPWAAGPPDPAAVVASFQPILAVREAGRSEESLLMLRERAEKGPYPGYAWYFLGEAAQREGALAAAVMSYRKAVAADPTVADRQSAFGTSDALRRSLAELKVSAWARSGPPELAELRYLERRLAGGCE